VCAFVEIKNAAVHRSTETHLCSKGYISVQRALNIDTAFTTTTTINNNNNNNNNSTTIIFSAAAATVLLCRSIVSLKLQNGFYRYFTP